MRGNALIHAGCIHLTLSSGAANVHGGGAWLCAFAAQAGDIEALGWFHARGCQWDELTPAKAAEAGQLAALRFVHSHGCPWGALTCCAAAGAGALGVLKYARAHECPWDKRTTAWAVGGGHLEVYHWAVQEGCHATDATRAEVNLQAQLKRYTENED